MAVQTLSFCFSPFRFGRQKKKVKSENEKVGNFIHTGTVKKL